MTIRKTIATRMSADDYIALEERYGVRNYKPLDVVLVKGNGIWVEDIEGKRFMDFLASYSAVNQGHCHPRLVAANNEQAQSLTLTSRAFRNDQLPLLEKELCELTGYEKMLPMNTGAEGVETAIKTARKWGYMNKGTAEDQAEILVCKGNFHGRTTTIVSFSSDPNSKKDFGPFTPGFKEIDYGDANALKAAITPNTVAFLFEPIQGEGGVIIPPTGYLKEVRDICTKENVLMIADEIQSGLGRAGSLLACDKENVRPDLAILGKALSGGFYPVSAVLGDKRVLDVFEPGQHGSTYGGNPLGSRVAREALKIITDEKLCERSSELGRYMLDELKKIQNPMIREIRGQGLWIAVEMQPEAGGARKYCEALKDKGILCKETHTHTIRLAPPLIITKDEIDQALQIFKSVLGKS